MHEIGALHQMVVKAEKIANEHHVRRIKALNIELGELSGMLPEFFEQYYDIVTEKRDIFKGSTLNITMIPGECLCCDCHAMFNVVKNKGICPRCGSREKKILSGTDLVLKNIITDDEPDL